MKINLVHNKNSIGKIYPHLASKTTREIKGLLVPTENYFKYRSLIRRYNEISDWLMTNKKSDKKLTGDLRNEFAELKQFYNKVAITIDDLKISDTNSVIRIIDNMIKTGLGNSVISIDSWNLKTRHLETEIATYKAEYKYPSELNNTIKIEKDGEILLEY